MPTPDTVRVPVTARFTFVAGLPVMVEAEYRDVPIALLAELLRPALPIAYDAAPPQAVHREA